MKGPCDMQSFSQPIEVREGTTLVEICQFRARVWQATGQVADHAFGKTGWHDPLDAYSRHWIIRDARQRLVAAGRLSLHGRLEDVHEAEQYTRWALPIEGPVAAPDRVVVCPSAQGFGLARLILDVQEEAARLSGARFAVRQASPRMVKLLRQRGWKMLGPASQDPRFPDLIFQVAVKSLAQLDAEEVVRRAG